MSYTYTKQETNDLVKDGDYECTIENIKIKTTPNGVEYLSLMFRVRDDVEQAYQNRCLFDSIWHPKDNPNIFNPKRINQLLGTQAVQDGQVFDSIDDVINFLTGAKLIAHVKTEFNEYQGKDVNVIKYFNKSAHLPQKLGDNYKKDAPDTGMKVVDDEDLPF